MADNQASGAAAAPAPEPDPPVEVVLEASAPADAQPPTIDAPEHPSWQRVQLARHPKRPQATDYIEKLFSGFEELHGDRAFGDDKAMIGGFAYFEGEPVMLIGQQKGRDTKSKLYRNFGMPKPEGYRKALRLMRLADKFHRPIVSLIDTAGAYPGIDAEERGQAEAIAYSLREMSRLSCPVIAVIIGEGGSGGALAIGVANRVYMLENAYYGVISPESCAAIVWRDAGKAPLAAAALKMTAEDLLRLKVIDGIVPEGPEGAHNDADSTVASLRETLKTALGELKTLSREQLIADRYTKFRQMGNFFHEERP
jgi:acetyl-CoA carboxylase carboxyl transferase subunit alpha